MENGPSEPGPSASAGAANEVTQTVRGRDQNPPTDVVRHGPGVPAILPAGQAEQVREDGWRADLPPEIVRYGPGVPATPSAGRAELTAERAWRATRPGGPS